MTESWTEVRLPIEDFTGSGAMLVRTSLPGGLTSVAIVAYGRDRDARIDVHEVGFY